MEQNIPLLSIHEIESNVSTGLASLPLEGKRLLVIVPDGTRTLPLPLFFRLITRFLRGRVKALDFLVALGTHPPLNKKPMLALFGLSPAERAAEYTGVRLLNHAWEDPHSLITVGYLSTAELEQISSGLLRVDVPVRVNRLVLDYDHLLVVGPVVPHEVAGFSGGNKYFIPGISGPEIIDVLHWLGALITSHEIIGRIDTPVRRVIDRAASFIPIPRHAFCCVATESGLAGLYFGTPEVAFKKAVLLAAQVHIRSLDRPYPQILSIMPTMYEEMWVGAKGMYKVEPVVADGGEVIIYAPHVRELSRAHGTLIRQVGYHVRDYFLQQWDRFESYPWGILAHSTHLRGTGTFQGGVEQPRIQVTLATGIPETICRQVGLGYRDPASIDPLTWMAQPPSGTLVVPRAGEQLYRLRD